jgi:hypothetical protein
LATASALLAVGDARVIGESGQAAERSDDAYACEPGLMSQSGSLVVANG